MEIFIYITCIRYEFEIDTLQMQLVTSNHCPNQLDKDD
jgi:hypothetical protein